MTEREQAGRRALHLCIERNRAEITPLLADVARGEDAVAAAATEQARRAALETLGRYKHRLQVEERAATARLESVQKSLSV